MKNKQTVYIETTIPSFLTARLSNNLISVGKQEVTRKWWETRKDKYSLYISELVLSESMKGDITASEKRLKAIEELPLLAIDNESIQLTEKIMETGIIPSRAAADAAHIAIASRHGVDYLLTWNCSHIANAEILRRICFIVSEAGYYLPIICTPDELFGGEEND